MKKILSLTFVLILLLSAVCILPASATYKGYSTKSGDFYYDILSDGTASIVYYSGNATHLTFPTEIDGIKVSEIDHPFNTYVFPYEPNTTVRSITVPEGILRCSIWAAPNLEELILPESLEDFCFVEGLRNSKIYKNPENWENGVLYLGNRLLDVDEEIAPAKIKVKEGTKFISIWAFKNNDKLTEITFPDSLERIELEAFQYCKSLSKINFNKNLKVIGDGAFYGCEKLTEIKLPQSLNTLESMAFYDCKKLNKISLPDTLQHIGKNTLKNTAFFNDPENFEDGLLYYKNYLLDYSDDFKGSCNIKEGTKIVADPMFIVCDKVTSVTFPDNIKGIGDRFFSNCDNLEYVKLPQGMDTLYAETFRNCKKLKSLIIPEGVTEIDEDAFLNCDSLEYIELPSTIEKIAYYSIGYRPSSTPGHEDLAKRYTKNTKNLVIAGYKNTVAEVYAEMFGFEFVDISSQYKEKVLELLNLTDENPITHYREEYRNYTEATASEATPDYVLINAHTAEHGDAFASKRFGDYILRSDAHYYPATFGYLIYQPKLNKIYSLQEAYELNIEDIEYVFTKGGIGELIGDANYDRKLNIKDATLIQKAVANMAEIKNNYIEGLEWKPDDNTPQYIADFNCDGKMNIRDATAIQKKLAKFDSPPSVPDEPEIPESTPTEPEATEPIPTEPEIKYANITFEGKTYQFLPGDKFTITIELYCEKILRNIDLIFNYGYPLKVPEKPKDDVNSYISERCPNLLAPVTLYGDHAYYPNFVQIGSAYAKGYDFTENKVLAIIEFEVTNHGDTEIGLKNLALSDLNSVCVYNTDYAIQRVNAEYNCYLTVIETAAK